MRICDKYCERVPERGGCGEKAELKIGGGVTLYLHLAYGRLARFLGSAAAHWRHPAARQLTWIAIAAALCGFQVSSVIASEAKATAHPDFSGFWLIDASLRFSGGNGPADLPEGWRGLGSFRTNPQPPLLPSVYEQVRSRRVSEHAATTRDGGVDEQTAACGPGGFPDMLEMMDPLDIHQRADELLMVTERERQLPRHVYIVPAHVLQDMYQPSKGGNLSNNGHAIGHWEGSTLIIDTDGFEPGPWMFSIDRIPHSGEMTTHERLSLSSDGAMLIDELTITDPKTLTKPWTLTIKYRRAPPGTEALESYCVPEH